MALEQLSSAADGDWSSAVAVPNGRQDETAKAARLPRWTRQEILVLIQGKRVAESCVNRRSRMAGLGTGSVAEPKWSTVSSYCKRHGVDRGPIQCRKRWSNLAGDFKKIREYESQIKDETESFWVLRNDVRREKKLPGFFDKEVFDVLSGVGTGGGAGDGSEVVLALGLGPSAAGYDGLLSDFEFSGQEDGGEGGSGKDIPADGEAEPSGIQAPTPISVEKQYQPSPPGPSVQGTGYEKEPVFDSEMGSTQDGRKRKRRAAAGDEETENLQQRLVDALERNGKIVISQLEAHNTHSQLEREQRRDHVNSLITVLDKVADALGRIADKL